MPNLYPTKSRMALLGDIANPGVKVYQCLTLVAGTTDRYTWISIRGESGHLERVVTARVVELERAGWVELDSGVEPQGISKRQPWRLTDMGRAILDAYNSGS